MMCLPSPCIVERWHFYRWKAGLLTFLHPEAPSRPNGQWLFCFMAITEFTAAGQSEIHTHVPN